MSSYTVEHVATNGSPFAFAMLLQALDSGESFVTYGSIKSELERQLSIPAIFTPQMGAVAGHMMDALLTKDPKAPLINVLICRPDGVPGRGAASYLASRYRDDSLLDWASVPKTRKLEIVERERRRILAYPGWRLLGEQAFGEVPTLDLVPQTGNEHDFFGSRGGEAESEDHRRLKLWVLANPSVVGIQGKPEFAQPEALLLSGDEVDVLFRSGGKFYTVEVKSKRSNDADLLRGIYQCVKYKAVKQAENAPFAVEVIAVLVTEASLPKHLAERAALLGVSVIDARSHAP